MSLLTLLNTNEIKNSGGTEVEFSRSSSEGSTVLYTTTTVVPAYPHTLSVKHALSGVGIAARRRSMFRFDKRVVGQVDILRPADIGGYFVMDIPIGNLTSLAEPANVMAECMSFLASTGASTTILYDCSGTGALTILNGSL